MQERKNKIKTRLSDFLRYQRGEMSESEMNSFERELQKDPFAEEASEGLGSELPDMVSKDIRHLQRLLKKRTARKQKIPFYRIAASVAVLMIISSVFIIIDRNKPESKLSEATVPVQPLEINVDKPLTEPLSNHELAQGPDPERKQKPEKTTGRQIIEETVSSVESVEAVKSKDLQIRNELSETESRTSAGYDAAKKATIPLSAAARAKTDTRHEIEMDTSITSLSEIVVTGYGVKRAEILKEHDSADFSAPYPVNGKAAFDNYIRESQQRPDTITAGQRVVVILTFIVRTNGALDSINIVRSPGKSFSDEAKRLVEEGPKWKPALDNRKPVDQEVRLRIVFR